MALQLHARQLGLPHLARCNAFRADGLAFAYRLDEVTCRRCLKVMHTPDRPGRDLIAAVLSWHDMRRRLAQDAGEALAQAVADYEYAIRSD